MASRALEGRTNEAVTTGAIRVVPSSDIETLLGLFALLEFGSGESLSGSNARAFREISGITQLSDFVAELCEVLIGTFALVVVSDAVPVL